MKIALGRFACFCIETRFGSDLRGGVQAALRFYTRSLESAMPPIAVPAFYFYLDRTSESYEVEFELAVDPEVEAALVKEASRQTVGMQQLLTHAVFVYLADLVRSEEVGATAR
jgi:hypothetical protein